MIHRVGALETGSSAVEPQADVIDLIQIEEIFRL